MADESTETVVTPNPAQPVVEAAPTTHTHSDRLLRICEQVGISRDEAANFDDAALRREIQDAQLELNIQQSRRPQSPQPSAPQPQTPADEEYDLGVNTEELDPTLVKALKKVGKDAAKAKRLEEEVKQLRQQQQQENLHRQVTASLDRLPAPGGSREARDRAIMAELAALESSGQLAGFSVEQAVQLAHRNLYGAGPARPATPAAPARPAATPTARPTNRLAPALQGKLDHLEGNGEDGERFIP